MNPIKLLFLIIFFTLSHHSFGTLTVTGAGNATNVIFSSTLTSTVESVEASFFFKNYSSSTEYDDSSSTVSFGSLQSAAVPHYGTSLNSTTPVNTCTTFDSPIPLNELFNFSGCNSRHLDPNNGVLVLNIRYDTSETASQHINLYIEETDSTAHQPITLSGNTTVLPNGVIDLEVNYSDICNAIAVATGLNTVPLVGGNVSNCDHIISSDFRMIIGVANLAGTSSTSLTESTNISFKIQNLFSNIADNTGVNTLIGKQPFILGAIGNDEDMASDDDYSLDDSAPGCQFNINLDNENTISDESSGVYDGPCGFSFSASDEKIILNSVTFNGTGSSIGTTYDGIRVYVFEDSLSSLLGSSPNLSSAFKTVDLTFSSTNSGSGTISDFNNNSIDGLKNGQEYTIFPAAIDTLGNITHLFTTNILSELCGPGPILEDECLQFTPGEVIGVLDENNCFVVTAASGSNSSWLVSFYRTFRDSTLEKTKIGRQFTKFYYQAGPYWAFQLQKKPVLKKISLIALIMLTPILSFFILLFQWPALFLCVMFSLILFKYSTVSSNLRNKETQ